MSNQKKPVIIDPAVRAAQFILTLRQHGMHSLYQAKMKQPVVVKRGIQ